MRYFLFLALTALTSQCTDTSDKILYKPNGLKDPIKYINYTGTERTEYFINAEMVSHDSDYHYNVRFLKSGKIMHIIKYESKYLEKSSTLESQRSKQFLVTDTSGQWGPTYFGESTNGYYDTFVVNNFLSQPNLQKKLSEISDSERSLFKIIDSLATVKNIRINKIDSSGLLGWFRYDF